MNQLLALPDPGGVLLAMAAARLMLRWPASGLEPLAGPLAATEALARAEEELPERLAVSRAPLALLARAARLSAFDIDLLGLAALPALDDRAAEAVMGLTGGVRRLTAGRAARLLLPENHDAAALRMALRDSPLWRAGLLRAVDPALPPAERLLDPTPALLAGLDGAWPEATSGGWVLQRVTARGALPESLAPVLAGMASWAAGEGAPLLLLDAPRSARAEEALAHAAAALGRMALLLHAPPAREPGHEAPAPWAEAGVISAATGALVALVSEAETMAAPMMPPIAPIAVIGVEMLRGHRLPLRRLAVPRPRMTEQRAHWARLLPDLAPAEHVALAAQTWAAAADIAAIASAAEGSAPLQLLAARMATAPPGSARLAQLRLPATPWSRLVLEPETLARLGEVVRRFRHRATVREGWGLDHGGPALVALLSGDPGTGKSLAAEAVASALGLPLLCADLSRIVSKYIGETEKNLAELFAAAEGFAAVLFFDEADALFGKRSAVQDAHDRYANIEVNYLLQRLERFEGIALLATNLAQGMDEAFLRRFDLSVPIPRPGAAERLALWRLHLPATLLAPGLDFDSIAQGFDMTGGEIRNAALTAAYAAAEAGARIGAAILRQALQQEFAKQGRPFPESSLCPKAEWT